VGLFSAVLFHGGFRICLRAGCCQIVKRHWGEPILLAPGIGVRGHLGLDNFVDWSVCDCSLGFNFDCSRNHPKVCSQVNHADARRRSRDCGVRVVLALQ
jgi:hypothetical protein